MRVNTTDLQNAFGKYLSLVDKEDIIITKNGKSVAKLIRYNEPDYYLVHEESKGYKTTNKVSYDEYMALVESSDQRYELIAGEIYLLASPSFKHQVVVNEIAWHLHNYFKGKPCISLTSPFDVRLSGFATKFDEDPNVVQPDILVICDKDKVNASSKYEGIPTLIVEVLSSTTKGKDMVTKLNLYMKSGIREYWVVNPEDRSIIQYCFSSSRDIDSQKSYRKEETIKSSFFAGLELSLRNIFAEI